LLTLIHLQDLLVMALYLNGKLGMIEIANKGSMVDVYHEAWHGFSQLFLTPEQKIELYKEVQRRVR
jgi:predicted DNA-binding protein YlxM (UPF0122 family)